ncbi:MAG: FAD-dependent oxidoreductase [Acidobacteriota bacterium]
MPEIAIIGSGLTGLSAGYHLKGFDYKIYEKDERVGGLLKSFNLNGFTFDHGGHLLHGNNSYFNQKIKEFLGENIISHKRKSFIHMMDTLIPFPFQVNLYGLPKEVIYKCVLGFIKKEERKLSPKNFKEWILKNFGREIAEHFLFPYNKKFWRRNLEKLTYEWCSWAIPIPDLEQIIKGSLGIKIENLGYNPEFHYPEKGGIESLIKGILKSIKNIKTNTEIVKVDPLEKEIFFKNGQKEKYKFLINTIPVKLFLNMLEKIPEKIRKLGESLDYISIYVLNLGIKGNYSDKIHWIYFPEEKYPFFRIGFYSNFSPCMAPEGNFSIFVEISLNHKDKFDEKTFINSIAKSLIDLKIIQTEKDILEKMILKIPVAYVIYNKPRQKNIPQIINYLESIGIYSTGRFGSWEYLNMEGSFLKGKETAERISGLYHSER